MGYIKHSASVIVAPKEKLEELQSWKAAIDEQYRDLICFSHGAVNAYVFACFLPDGSREGWSTSDDADKLREEFVAKFASDVVSVDFGGDDDILRMQTAERRWFDGKEWKYE